MVNLPFKTDWVLDAPTGLTIKNVRSAHNIFMFFVFISKKKGHFAPCNINWLFLTCFRKNCDGYYIRHSRLSVCLSVGMQQLVSYWRDFHEIWYSYVFKKSIEEIKFH